VSDEVGRSGFAVEIRARYRDVVRDRWPVSINPQPDELLSSWIHRLAIANGIAPRSFANVLGLDGGMWSARLDLRLPSDVAALLESQTGISPSAISTMATVGWALTPLLLPLRESVHRNRSTWMQYCPLCLLEDQAPYFRRQWRLASRVSCFAHGCGLRDRCPACRRGIAAFDQIDLLAQHFCVGCGFDLRQAPKASVKVSARRLERTIDDIVRLESAKGLLSNSDLISRLLRAPSTMTLTSLSTFARIRCLEGLAAGSLDWIGAGEDTTVAHWRRLILAAGSHARVITRLADHMEKRQKSARSVHLSPPGADLPALLEAYARVIG
jgi:hypothetical protein